MRVSETLEEWSYRPVVFGSFGGFACVSLCAGKQLSIF